MDQDNKPHLPGTIRLEVERHYTVACPTCGGDLSISELRLFGGDPEWYLICGEGHEWVALTDLWGPGPLTIFLARREDGEAHQQASARQDAARTAPEKLKAHLQAKGFFDLPLEERIAKHEAAMRALEAVPRFNDEAAYRALGKE